MTEVFIPRIEIAGDNTATLTLPVSILRLLLDDACEGSFRLYNEEMNPATRLCVLEQRVGMWRRLRNQFQEEEGSEQ